MDNKNTQLNPNYRLALKSIKLNKKTTVYQVTIFSTNHLKTDVIVPDDRELEPSPTAKPEHKNDLLIETLPDSYATPQKAIQAGINQVNSYLIK